MRCEEEFSAIDPRSRPSVHLRICTVLKINVVVKTSALSVVNKILS